MNPLQWVIGAVVLLNLLRIILGDVAGERSGPDLAIPTVPSAHQLSNPIVDVDLALESLFGPDLDVATIQVRNPGLAALLETNWRIARDEGRTMDRFADTIGELLATRFQAALPTASYAVIAEHRRIAMDEAVRLRRRSAADCAALFTGGAGQRIADPALLKRRRAAMIATLLEGDVTAPVRAVGPRQFSIDGDTVDAAARRAGLTPDRLGEALLDRGTAKEECDARIALIETALALPRAEGLKLLRAM